jgi:hypothetical protein
MSHDAGTTVWLDFEDIEYFNQTMRITDQTELSSDSIYQDSGGKFTNFTFT